MSSLYQLRVCACLSAAGAVPFGRNKKLTMPRAQKTKVPARNDAWQINDHPGVTGAKEPTPSASPPPTFDAPAAPSPGQAKRKLAKDELGELGTAYMAWSDIDAEAEKELRMSLRLYAAKVRRIEKAQAGKRHGSPYLELERIYKAELELTKVTHAEVEVDANNAEANLLAQQCLENAKLRPRVLMGMVVCACEKGTLGPRPRVQYRASACSLVFWACITGVLLHGMGRKNHLATA